jgi:toxin CcdB
MAQFDVYRMQNGGLVLDVQADIFADIGTRLVVPLMREEATAPTTPRLHPRFLVSGEELILMTELAAAIRTSDLRQRVTSLAQERFRIIGAIDVLLGGV